MPLKRLVLLHLMSLTSRTFPTDEKNSSRSLALILWDNCMQNTVRISRSSGVSSSGFPRSAGGLLSRPFLFPPPPLPLSRRGRRRGVSERLRRRSRLRLPLPLRCLPSPPRRSRLRLRCFPSPPRLPGFRSRSRLRSRPRSPPRALTRSPPRSPLRSRFLSPRSFLSRERLRLRLLLFLLSDVPFSLEILVIGPSSYRHTTQLVIHSNQRWKG